MLIGRVVISCAICLRTPEHFWRSHVCQCSGRVFVNLLFSILSVGDHDFRPRPVQVLEAPLSFVWKTGYCFYHDQAWYHLLSNVNEFCIEHILWSWQVARSTESSLCIQADCSTSTLLFGLRQVAMFYLKIDLFNNDDSRLDPMNSNTCSLACPCQGF